MAASLLFVATGCGSKEVTQPPLAGELVATVAGGSGKIVNVAWSPTGYLATADADAVTVWNPPATEPIRTFSDLYGGMFALSPDGQSLAAFTKDGTWNVLIRNVTTGELECTLVNNSAPVGSTQSFSDLNWSPDGQWIAVASTLGARIFNTATGALAWEFEGGASNLGAVSWSPDGTRLAADLRLSEVQIWDIVNGQATATTVLARGPGNGVHWSPDGSRMATLAYDGDNRGAQIWDTKSGDLIRVLDQGQKTTTRLAWSPDGERLATADEDGTVRTWDAASGAVLHTLSGHTDAVMWIAWSPDGTQLASGSQDGTARVWNTKTGQLIATLTPHVSIGWSGEVAWSFDGTRLATTSPDGVQIWR